MHVHTHTHTCMHTHMCTRTCTYVRTYIHTYIHTHITQLPLGFQQYIFHTRTKYINQHHGHQLTHWQGNNRGKYYLITYGGQIFFKFVWHVQRFGVVIRVRWTSSLRITDFTGSQKVKLQMRPCICTPIFKWFCCCVLQYITLQNTLKTFYYHIITIIWL